LFCISWRFFAAYRGFVAKPREHIVELPPSRREQEDPSSKSFELMAESKSIADDETIYQISRSIEPESEIVLGDDIEPSSIFSGRIAFLAQQRRVNSETFFTREDLPENIRQEFDLAMENYERDGYFNTDESVIEKINAPFNEVEAFELDDPALMISAEKIENTLLADLAYVGVIPDRISEQEGAPVTGIRRVFESEAGYVALYEGDLRTSDALLQKELVNKSIKGYPATQIKYCAPSMRCVTQLSWLTNDKRYELTLSGDVTALDEDVLVKIASSLNLPPPPQDLVEK
jgi:hypothetical protein